MIPLHLIDIFRVFVQLSVLFVITCFSAPAQSASGTGFVDAANLTVASRQITLSGWAAPEQSNVFTTNLIVRLGGQEIYRGRMERFERSDVVQHTGRVDWLWSGFNVRISIPDDIDPGQQLLTASMHLGDGSEFELGIAPAAQMINVPAQPGSISSTAQNALFLALAMPFLVLLGVHKMVWPSGAKKQAARRYEPMLFGIAVFFSFMLLVAAGWTGSSLGLGLDDKDIVSHDEIAWLGSLQSIRSDEWSVITPLAISQIAHQPAFPRINRNLGTDGQNMLVIGMTGVPVLHVSAIVKPATWGFFLFDLRRALAWYWWFPFFACFIAVWLVLLRFFSLDWRLAAGLAISVSASPYSVVFSGWPAYAVFFPSVGLLAADAAMRSLRWQQGVLVGAMLGLAVAGFALVLYPAWQISLAYLFVPFALAYFAAQLKDLRFGVAQGAAVATALVVCLLVLIPWWLDAQDAIASIRATVYPGQRSVEVGGDIDRWFLIKGLMSPMTMYLSTMMVGASDAGSVVFFLLPAAAAVALRWLAQRRLDISAGVLFGYIAIVLWFMFVGFNSTFARWSLWSSITSYRLDLALGMAQVLIFAWLASPRNVAVMQEQGHWTRSKLVGLVVAALAVLHASVLYGLVPPPIIEAVPSSYILLSLLALGAGAFCLIRGYYAAVFGVYGTVMLAAALPFNPTGLAPTFIKLTPAFMQATSILGKGTPAHHGIAVIGERNWSMTLPAAGLPVINSVFYYPQETLWRKLDPSGLQRNLYNRYQRVLFELSHLPQTETYRIDSPRLDEVRVTIDPRRFDFRLLGGQAVLTTGKQSEALLTNPTLRLTHSTVEWTVFKVVIDG